MNSTSGSILSLGKDRNAGIYFSVEKAQYGTFAGIETDLEFVGCPIRSLVSGTRENQCESIVNLIGVIMQTQFTDWSSSLLASLTGAMGLFFSAVPKIIGFVAVIIVGWLVASLIAKAIYAALSSIKFNDLARRSGFSDFIRKMGAETDSVKMIATVSKWFIRLITMVVAFDALGLPAVSDVLRQVLLWMPNAVVALVVLVIGGLAANALSNIVRAAAEEGGLSNSAYLAKAASVLVWGFTVVVAVNQIGIATTLINTLFMAIVGALALALGLAFGLGGRETASEIVRKWYSKGQEEVKVQATPVVDSVGNIIGKITEPTKEGTITHH